MKILVDAEACSVVMGEVSGTCEIMFTGHVNRIINRISTDYWTVVLIILNCRIISLRVI